MAFTPPGASHMKHLTYYEILHVQPDAPPALIKVSYRTLLQALGAHPDLGGSHDDAVLINEAYATLSDPVKRETYDRRLAAMAAVTAAQRAAGQAPTPSAAVPETHSDATPLCPFCRARVCATAVDDPDSLCHACGSALYVVKKERLNRSSRRAVARWPRTMPMGLQRAGRPQRFTAVTEDVSLNGIGFSTTLDLQVGEMLSLECQFCSAVGVVKNVRPGAAGSNRRQVGVEFVTLRIKRERGGLVSTVA